jgi:hypothetical protein
MYTREIDDEREGKLEQKYDVAFGTIFRISKGFQRSKQKLYLVIKGRLKILKPSVFAHVLKVLIQFYRPFKNISIW